VLILSIALAILPLLGVAYVLFAGEGISVDSLFTSLILLAISGVFGLNTLLMLRSRLKAASAGDSGSGAGVQFGSAARGAVVTARGLVESVLFFESPVGYADKSIVTLRLNGAKSTRVLPFEGDLRNLLPVGKMVEVKYEGDGSAHRIVALNYR
jgi:hypothetical protein